MQKSKLKQKKKKSYDHLKTIGRNWRGISNLKWWFQIQHIISKSTKLEVEEEEEEEEEENKKTKGSLNAESLRRWWWGCLVLLSQLSLIGCKLVTLYHWVKVGGSRES